MRLRECFHRLRVDGRPKRIKKFAFTIVFVWTGPEMTKCNQTIKASLLSDDEEICKNSCEGIH